MSTDQDALFDASPFEVEQGPVSADRRRTLRQSADIERGRHPPHGGPLHPDAPEGIDKTRRGVPFTCGSCAHRVVAGRPVRAYPKCDISAQPHGPSTDVRAWWPACTEYQGGGSDG